MSATASTLLSKNKLDAQVRVLLNLKPLRMKRQGSLYVSIFVHVVILTQSNRTWQEKHMLQYENPNHA